MLLFQVAMCFCKLCLNGLPLYIMATIRSVLFNYNIIGPRVLRGIEIIQRLGVIVRG